MTQDELGVFYRGEYRREREGTDQPTEKDLRVQEARAQVTVQWASARLRPPSRHLDVGSSSGALLEAFRDSFGSAGAGIEPGEAYRTYSRERGLQVFADLADLAQAEAGRFDLLTLMHVLEHFPDPVGMLTHFRQDLLVPGAHLLVEVPNLFDHEAFELPHLHAFTPRSLKDTVRRAGFRIVQSRVHGTFRSPILRLYITLLAVAGDRPTPMGPLPLAVARTRLARRIGAAKRRFFTRLYPDWTWQSPEKVLSREPSDHE
jgi:SAM-dependent methyltransferase